MGDWKEQDIIEILTADLELEQSIKRLAETRKAVEKASKTRITEILEIDDVTDDLCAEAVEMLSNMREAKRTFDQLAAPMKEERAALKTAVKDRVENQTPFLNFSEGDDD